MIFHTRSVLNTNYKILNILRTYIKAFMGNGKNGTIELTIKSNQYEEGDCCALELSWINNVLEPLNMSLLYCASYFNILYLINNGMEYWHESCIHSGMTYFVICQNPTYWILICVIQMLYGVNPYDSTHSERYIVICAFIANNVK